MRTYFSLLILLFIVCVLISFFFLEDFSSKLKEGISDYFKTKNTSKTDEILVHVYVFKSNRTSAMYEPREGEPKYVGVYKFFLSYPPLPGSGTFEKIDSINLSKLNETTFFGEKYIKKINGTMCIGYPSSNFIDNVTCVKIDQNKREVWITIRYLKCKIAIE